MTMRSHFAFASLLACELQSSVLAIRVEKLASRHGPAQEIVEIDTNRPPASTGQGNSGNEKTTDQPSMKVFASTFNTGSALLNYNSDWLHGDQGAVGYDLAIYGYQEVNIRFEHALLGDEFPKSKQQEANDPRRKTFTHFDNPFWTSFGTVLRIEQNSESKWSFQEMERPTKDQHITNVCVPPTDVLKDTYNMAGCTINNVNGWESGKVVNFIGLKAMYDGVHKFNLCAMNTHMSLKGDAKTRGGYIKKAHEVAKGMGCDSLIFVGDFNSRPHCDPAGSTATTAFWDKPVNEVLAETCPKGLDSCHVNEEHDELHNMLNHDRAEITCWKEPKKTFVGKIKRKIFGREAPKAKKQTEPNPLIGSDLKEPKLKFAPTYKMVQTENSDEAMSSQITRSGPEEEFKNFPQTLKERNAQKPKEDKTNKFWKFFQAKEKKTVYEKFKEPKVKQGKNGEADKVEKMPGKHKPAHPDRILYWSTTNSVKHDIASHPVEVVVKPESYNRVSPFDHQDQPAAPPLSDHAAVTATFEISVNNV